MVTISCKCCPELFQENEAYPSMIKMRKIGGTGAMEHRVHTYRRCPVCGCEVGSVLFPVDLFVEDMGLPNHYDAVRCDDCFGV